MEEHWKHVFGFNDLYAVSSRGRVFSFRHKKLMKFRVGPNSNHPSDQYFYLRFCVCRVTTYHFVHNLVLTAFRGPCPSGYESRHLDGDRFNNNITNLEWGTRTDNIHDRRKHRKKVKLTPDLVRYIRDSSQSVRVLAKELGCSKTAVHEARIGKRSWVDIRP